MPSMRTDSSSSGPEILRGIFGPYVVSPADSAVASMEETSGDLRRAFALHALSVDRWCLEARMAIAATYEDPKDRIRWLADAVRFHDALWKPVAARYGRDMTWWYFPGTRPYMRAIHALGRALEADGDLEKAARCYRRLVRMCPRDPQRARHDLERVRDAMEQAPLPAP